MPVPRLVSELSCVSCGWTVALSAMDWLGLLEEALQRGPFRLPREGEQGRASARSWDLELRWHVTQPCAPTPEQPVDLERVADAAAGGLSRLADLAGLALLPAPSWLQDRLAAAVCVLEERPNGLDAAHRQDASPPAQSASVLLGCPGCGSPLRIDGRSRTLACAYCGNSSLVPPEVWERFHPTPSAHPWYLILDARRLPVDWDSSLLQDALADSKGRLYLVLWVDSDGASAPVATLVCVDATRLVVWSRQAPSLEPWNARGALIQFLAEERIGFWVDPGSRMEVLSRRDGTPLAVWEAAAPSDRPQRSERLDLSRVESMAQGEDRTIVAWYREGESADEGPFRLRRFGSEGGAVPTWSRDEPGATQEAGRKERRGGATPRVKQASILSRIFGRAVAPDEPEAVAAARSPTRNLESEAQSAFGRDRGVRVLLDPGGDVFLVNQQHIGRFRRNGVPVFFAENPSRHWKRRQPAFLGADGILMLPDRDCLWSVDARGRSRVHARPQAALGPLGTEARLAVAEDGTAHLLGPMGEWIVVSPEGRVLRRQNHRFGEWEPLTEPDA